MPLLLLLVLLGGGGVTLSDAATTTNSWAVQVENGGSQAADALAEKHGFINLGQVGSLAGVYHFVMPARMSSGEMERKGIADVPMANHFTDQLNQEQNVMFAAQQERKKKSKKNGYNLPTDPRWSDQWSLLNTGQLNSSDAGRDLNVERVWLQGLTGCGIVVAVVDDGIEYTHPDLTKNYVSSIEYDFLSRQKDPFPVTFEGERESHGTNVAGEIAMEKGNDVCGIGVAYNAFITALRLISSPGSTDMDDAEALSWQEGVVDIYSNSWGPPDDGFTIDGPLTLSRMALETGARQGRDGKGSIYVFAAGNGGSGDTCAADGYTNSIYTISVGSAGSDGRQSSFDEACSGKMVVTFDSDPYLDTRHILTANIEGQCYNEFVGTSASTPLVSAVIALLLEANPDLTWRDVQYLLAYTSNRNTLVDGVWVTNGAGIRVSSQFGFGALDAEALISRGRHWITVPPQLKMSLTPSPNSFTLSGGESMSSTFTVTSSSIVSLEHVVLTFSSSFEGVTEEQYEQYYYEYYYNDAPITWPRRGAIAVFLRSPSGTTSTLLPQRPFDVYPGPYDDWEFLSLHFWGEEPEGEWTIQIRFDDIRGTLQVEVPQVTLYGTSRVPEAVSRIPTMCSEACDPTRGCANTGAEFCDACAEFRVASTLECVSSCPEGLSSRNGYCYDSSQSENICEAEPPTISSSSVRSLLLPGTQVLILLLLIILNTAIFL